MNHHETVDVAGTGPERTKRNSETRRLVAILALAALTLGVVSGCGSDESAEDAFCDAGDSLQANVEGIKEIDVIANGSSAISEQFDAIESDLEKLKDSGSDVAADEISALESAVDELNDALDALGDDISVEAAQGVGNSVSSVVAAAESVLAKLTTSCS